MSACERSLSEAIMIACFLDMHNVAFSVIPSDTSLLCPLSRFLLF